MAGYYKITVVEITITVDFSTATRYDIINGRVITTTKQKTLRTLLLECNSTVAQYTFGSILVEFTSVLGIYMYE